MTKKSVESSGLKIEVNEAVFQAARAIARRRAAKMGEMAAALRGGDDSAALGLARELCGIGSSVNAQPAAAGLPRLVDAEVLAEQFGVPVSWISEYTRKRAKDPIPHLKMGKYVKFDLSDPKLPKWLERRRKGGRQVS